MLTLLILPTWARLQLTEMSPFFYAVFLFSHSLPTRPYFYTFTNPLRSLSTILVYLTLCPSAERHCSCCLLVTTCNLKICVVWNFLTESFFVGITLIIFGEHWHNNTFYTVNISSWHNTMPTDMSSVCQGPPNATLSLHLKASLTAS